MCRLDAGARDADEVGAVAAVAATRRALEATRQARATKQETQRPPGNCASGARDGPCSPNHLLLRRTSRRDSNQSGAHDGVPNDPPYQCLPAHPPLDRGWWLAVMSLCLGPQMLPGSWTVPRPGGWLGRHLIASVGSRARGCCIGSRCTVGGEEVVQYSSRPGLSRISSYTSLL